MSEEAVRPNSDFGVRALSALAMICVASGAIWAGGWFFDAFVLLLACLIFREWQGLTSKISPTLSARSIWFVGGIIYIGLAAATLIFLGRLETDGGLAELVPISLVVATDVGAYFAGRAIGGPKIAPRISPSKTWAGLLGGMLCAGAVMFLLTNIGDAASQPFGEKILTSALATAVAVVAQTGDFLQSWMKRRAGVKDSGTFLPGHGGFFDRADGLIAVLFIGGLWLVFSNGFHW